MTTEKRWTIDVVISEHERQTRAQARVEGKAGTEHVGVGEARRNPQDRDIPEIGDELAVSRALSDLAHRLLDAAARDIENVTHEPSRLEA
ncbi:MAG: DUF1876 domain-containing protein [Propionibacteriales bacterium]|nr:DUF1876 domain-containing protein [Propionibacteriales bacterium]